MERKLVQLGLTESGKPSFNFIRHLSAAEAESYEAAQDVLHEFGQTRRLLRLLTTNEATVARLQVELIAASKENVKRRSPERTEIAHDLDAAVVNYLTASRLYLEHRQTQLNHRYGKSSPQLAAFNAARSAQFEEHEDYRFIYKLRNYVQHCGMPLQVVSARHTIALVGDQEAIHHEFLIGCDRDRLLSEYSEWRAARAFLEQQPAKFELLPLLRAFTGHLRAIDFATLKVEMPEVWHHGCRLLNVIAEVCDAAHTGALGALGPLSESGAGPEASLNYTVTLSEPPVGMLLNLGLIEELPTHPWWRIRHDRIEAGVPPHLIA